MSNDYLLSNLTDWIIPTFHPEDPTVSALPVSVPSLNYTFLLDSPCVLSLQNQTDDSLIFQEATKDALSELYDEYFGSDGRAKFQNMTLHLQKWDMSLTNTSNSSRSRSTQRTRKYTLSQNKLQLGFKGDALFQYSPAPNEQLLNAVNEHLLSSPQLLSQMGQTILQQLIIRHNNPTNNNNNSSCANSSSFQILTSYSNTTPFVVPSFGTIIQGTNSTSTVSTGIHTNNNISSPTQIETLGAEQTNIIGSPNSPFAETNTNVPSTEDLTTTTTTPNNSNNPVNQEIQNTTTKTSTQTSQNSQSTLLIVGIAVFSSIILFIGLGFLYVFIQKRRSLQRIQRQQRLKQHDYIQEDDEDRATSAIIDDEEDRSLEAAADFFYNNAERYQQEQQAIAASMTKHANNITNSLLSPTTATAAAVLLASKSTSQKNTTTINNNNNNNNNSRIYNRASAAAHLDEYDICARSTYTLEDNQSEQQQPSLGPQSLAESIPLEDILNTQDNNNNNISGSQRQPHYANQSVQLETIIRSLTAPGEKNSTNNVPPPSANAAPPIISPAAVILPALKKTVSFSEPEQQQEKKQKSPSYSATSSSLLSSYNNTNESSWRLTQPSRFVGDENNEILYQEEEKYIANSKNREEEEGDLSLAESSLCMSKKDLIDLIGVARNKSKEEDYALHRLLTTKQSFVQTT